MAPDDLTFRISGLPEFWARASRDIVTENTSLLDTFNADANGVVVLRGWSPKIFDFFLKLLHYKDDELREFLDGFEAEVKDVWSIASFHEKYVRQAEVADDDNTETREPGQPTVRMRRWFGRWWEEERESFRGVFASDLIVLVMPAFYIGDAQTFMSVTYDCFLHTDSKQAESENARMPQGSDLGGMGAINTEHPLLDKLAAVRGSMIGKIEKSLAYDVHEDGLPDLDPKDDGDSHKSPQCEDPSWCPMLKLAAYHIALQATGCWPVMRPMRYRSIHEVLTMLTNNFNYINYDNIPGMPDRAVARTKKPGPQETAGDKRCTVCVDAAVKAAFDSKVKRLIHTLLDDKTTWVPVKRQGKTVMVEVNDSFAGLCLDCLTKTKFGSEDADYWNHCRLFEFDHGCTVRHSQPTWYFSYLGRPESLEQFNAKLKRAQPQIPRHGGR